MITVISETKPVARKEYRCNACDWIENIVVGNIGDYEFSYAELRAIAKARRNKWRILPGEVYIRQVNKEGGDIYTWRAIPAIHDICVKYDIYDY